MSIKTSSMFAKIIIFLYFNFKILKKTSFEIFQTKQLHRKSKNTVLSLGVKPLIRQSELRTYTKVVPFQEKKFLSLCSIVKTTEWNGLIEIDN